MSQRTPRPPALGRPQSRLTVASKFDGVPAQAVREHVDRLRDAGMTINMIARGAGVTHQSVRHIIGRSYETVTRPVASAILATTPRPMKHQALVMAYPTRRRIEALCAAGWPIATQAARAGRTKGIWCAYTRAKVVTWETHCLVSLVYDELSHLDGGSERAKARARREGFIPPIMWDDIDDYGEVPDMPADTGAVDEVAVRRLVDGQAVPGHTTAERDEAIRILTARGRSAAEIAVILGISDRSVQRHRSREARAC